MQFSTRNDLSDQTTQDDSIPQYLYVIHCNVMDLIYLLFSSTVIWLTSLYQMKSTKRTLRNKWQICFVISARGMGNDRETNKNWISRRNSRRKQQWYCPFLIAYECTICYSRCCNHILQNHNTMQLISAIVCLWFEHFVSNIHIESLFMNKYAIEISLIK